MHLQVNQRLQEIASYKRDKFNPEEVDLALNKAMYRMLERAVSQSFQNSQVNLVHVNALINKNEVGEVIIPSSTDPLYEYPLLPLYTVLPSDFYWLVNARAEVVEDTFNCSTAPNLTTTNYLEYVATVAFPDLDSAPYYDSVRVRWNNTTDIYTAPSAISAGFSSPYSKYVVVNHILEYFYRNPSYTNLRVYWERYRDVYYQDTFIFVSTTPFSQVEVFSGNKSRAATPATQTYSIYNRALITSHTDWSRALRSCSNKEQDMLYDALTNNRFYRTLPNQPVVTQTLDYLILYRDESFLITRSYYDYIRKPRTISLALNQSCELAESTHHMIIDLAIEILRLDIKDQAYSATVQDTELRTN